MSTHNTDPNEPKTGNASQGKHSTPGRMPLLRTLRYVLWAFAIIATLGAGYEYWQLSRPAPVPTGTEAMKETIKSEFSLVDHTGTAVTQDNFRGNWQLVFFGFTNCPDVCPTTLNQIAEIMDNLGENAAEVRPLFITVDPERDTPERMAEYVTAFDTRIVGLTGTPEQVKAAANSFKIYYAKAASEGAPDGYLMDHTAYLYLMNPEGGFEAFFSHDSDVRKTSVNIQQYLLGQKG